MNMTIILGTISQRRLLVLFLFGFCFPLDFVSPISEKEILLQFKGNISTDPFGCLKNWDPNKSPCPDYGGVSCNSYGRVAKIVLWNCSLGGVLSPALSGLRSLRIITLFGNQFTGDVPFEYREIDALWKVNLSSNALSGPIPEFLGGLPNLRFLDLSRNGFSGGIPSTLFRNCYKTRFVSLARNNLSGPIPVSVGNCLNLEGVDLSFNRLDGELPSQVCDLPEMAYLSVRSNMLSGNVDGRFRRCRRLELLDLGSNMFSGGAPLEVVGFSNITYFNISWNMFAGEILDVGACNLGLEVFDVSGNDLYGEVPRNINRCSGLKYLDLGFNRLNGTIPVGIADLKRLLVIRLANNSIDGTIPTEFGSIEWLEVLDLHNLRLHSDIPKEITNCKFLLEIDLSGNSFEGEIPRNLDNMTYLEILDLHQNRLNGSIPLMVGNLSNLHSLDFSQNSLSGPIPSTIGNLENLTHFNVSYNALSGPIPPSQSIQDFGFSAFFHNPSLCGPPLENPCSSSVSTRATRKRRLSPSSIVAIVAAVLILTGVCLITVINMRARGSAPLEDEAVVLESTPLASTESSNLIIGKLVLFGKSLPSKYEDWETGTKALLDKECVIGRGSIGTVYKTTLEGGVSIAVKKLESLGRINGQDEFEHEIGLLGNLQHPNLVAIQGYYWSSSMRLILSEFVPRGNLHDNLHGFSSYPGTSTGYGSSNNNNPNLNWARRFKIAIGIARGLAYLHHDCQPQILHLNIKSTNIILDESFEAKISDYGLEKLTPLFTKIHNAVGYIAPELAQSSRITDKSNVYSFGVILLELVTGRKPVESPGGSEVIILCEYVKGLIERGKGLESFDKSMGGFYSENEVMQVMKLGLICTCERASRRPSMAEVVQVLESIRNNGLES